MLQVISSQVERRYLPIWKTITLRFCWLFYTSMGAFQKEQAPFSLCVETDTLLWLCVSFRQSSFTV